jgi:arylsulfatase A-like enzyme
MRTSLLLAQVLAIAVAWIGVARFAPAGWRGASTLVLKLWLTALVFVAILLHEEDGRTLYATLGDLVAGLDVATLVGFSLLATGVRLAGIGASITRWVLMLRGQEIRLPVRHIVGSFFIGRFLGTFLPSTIGLDGYKLWDAARFSGRTIEVTTATAVEKLLGISGIFGAFLISLPLGVSIFESHAPLIAGLGVPIALSPLVAIALGFFWPGPVAIRFVLARLPLPTLSGTLERIAAGASAYARHKGLLFAAWALSLASHFLTAATYYFTARALGVQPADASFWQVTFASSIQIFATVISPFTIAGEGIRELAQGYLLQNQMTFAVAAASGLLGFLVAEAPTLLGAIPWFARRERYRPAYCLVLGEQVDWEVARRAAADLGASARKAPAAQAGIEPVLARLRTGAGLGLAAGVYAGVLLGFAEAAYLLLTGKVAQDAQVFWVAPLAYGALFGTAGALGGALLGALPFPRSALERLVPPLGLVACAVPFGTLAALFFLYRDVHGEHMPPLAQIGSVLAGAAVVALALLASAWIASGTRLRALLRARTALVASGLAIAGAAALGAVAGPRALDAHRAAHPMPPALRDAPNVLFVIVDTLRADELPAYGGAAVRAPAFDRIAAEGTVFRAFAQASWTKPSIASLLTGLYPSSHRAVHKPSQLPDSVDTLAEVLDAFGYTTGGIVTNVNLAPSFNFQQGFDEYAYLAPDYLFGLAESSSRTLFYEVARRVAARLAGAVRPGQAYQPAEVVNRHAREWLDRHGAERFFLLLHYMDPHDPYFAHPDDGRAIARSTTPRPDPALRDEIVRRYRGEIEYLDARLGELVADLERRGLWNDLLVVVTSDHGEEFFEHGGWWHGLTLYDEQIGVPLLVKWPGTRRPAPARWEAQVRSIDIAPTLLARLGAPVPPAMQGDDLLASGPRERVVFAEEDHEGNVLEALRTRDWKVVRANAGNPRGLPELELFALRQDPRETQSLHAEHSGRAQRMLGELERAAKLARAEAREERVTTIDRRECERLKALGYVEDCGS